MRRKISVLVSIRVAPDKTIKAIA
ncbi:hypothetical protein CORC01_00362 [Colletotrichum orchidophilum]|uniref:Uncharacterized protein n=1 Tax=Colletotrichum orchidophilum TaxID=1209926 RepID=A0A1G4BSX4_9PEZI|nr:hypothetical protein CORC01_00362 [Colletotrichum orchidophilum]